MPLPNIPKAQFPNVPIAPGVPPLLRQVGAIQNDVVLLVNDARIIFNHFQGPKWGLFDKERKQIIAADSVIDVAYRQETRISTAPQENGAFMAYNKVGTPFDARITFAKGGTEQERQDFLTQIALAQQALTLYVLVTPTINYRDVNVIHYDYRRSITHGTQLLTVDVWLEQVRMVDGPAFSNTASPTGADAVNDGQVQTQAPNPTENGAAPAGGLT